MTQPLTIRGTVRVVSDGAEVPATHIASLYPRPGLYPRPALYPRGV